MLISCDLVGDFGSVLIWILACVVIFAGSIVLIRPTNVVPLSHWVEPTGDVVPVTRSRVPSAPMNVIVVHDPIDELAQPAIFHIDKCGPNKPNTSWLDGHVLGHQIHLAIKRGGFPNLAFVLGRFWQLFIVREVLDSQQDAHNLSGRLSVVPKDWSDIHKFKELPGRTPLWNIFESAHNPCSLAVHGDLRLSERRFGRSTGFVALPRDYKSRENDGPGGDPIGPCQEFVEPWHVIVAILGFFGAGVSFFKGNGKSGTVFLAFCFIFSAGVMLLTGHRYDCADGNEYPYDPRPISLHIVVIVPQKRLDSI